jgi:hypothetical protein
MSVAPEYCDREDRIFSREYTAEGDFALWDLLLAMGGGGEGGGYQ